MNPPSEEEAEGGEGEGGKFIQASAVNEQDPERDRATPA